jgi:1-phosphofructokinase family hexose kinase
MSELVWIEGETRTNISIRGKNSADYIKVNDPGPRVDRDAVRALLERIHGLTRPGDLWVMSGSLPPGAPPEFYARAIETARAGGAEVFLDTSGAALRMGCEAKPALIKPNLDEIIDLTGQPIESPQGAAGAAAALRKTGLGQVVISLGAMGVVAAEASSVWHCPPLPVRSLNPVGAGDALLAGMAAARVRGWEFSRGLRLGAACGASAVEHTGTGIGSREEIERLFRQAQAYRMDGE